MGAEASCCGSGPTKRSAAGEAARRVASEHTIEEAIRLFNAKPKKGVAYVFEHELCAKDDAAALADLLHDATKDLDKAQMGDYLGDFPEFNGQVLREFVRGVPFTGLGFDDALRLFLSTFHLPGEAQKIDRFMEAFAAEFMRTHPGLFANPDTPYILAFSTIMLNTDHFSSGIREDRRMTRDQFISNNRAIDTALTPQFLGTMFDRIISNEIVMSEMEAGDTRSILCYTNPRKHGWLQKVTPGMMMNSEEKVWFVLKDRTLYYLEAPPALGVPPLLCGMIPLDSHDMYRMHCNAPKGGRHSDRKIEIFCTGPDGSRQNVKALKIRHRHHEHHYTEAEERESFILVAADASEEAEWVAAIDRAIEDTYEDYLEAVARAKTPQDSTPAPAPAPTPQSDEALTPAEGIASDCEGDSAAAAALKTKLAAAHAQTPDWHGMEAGSGELQSWVRAKLQATSLEKLKPHEQAAAKVWLGPILLGRDVYNRSSVEHHSGEALQHIPAAALPDHTHSRSEESQCALMHWMFQLVPEDLAAVQEMVRAQLAEKPDSLTPEALVDERAHPLW